MLRFAAVINASLPQHGKIKYVNLTPVRLQHPTTRFTIINERDTENKKKSYKCLAFP